MFSTLYGEYIANVNKLSEGAIVKSLLQIKGITYSNEVIHRSATASHTP